MSLKEGIYLDDVPTFSGHNLFKRRGQDTKRESAHPIGITAPHGSARLQKGRKRERESGSLYKFPLGKIKINFQPATSLSE